LAPALLLLGFTPMQVVPVVLISELFSGLSTGFFHHNKGMSGGGYGPVVTGGQIQSGVDGKSAVGITSLAEGLTCLVGIVAYVMLAKSLIDWKLAPWIIGGAIVSVPLAAVSVKKIKTKKLRLVIAMLIIILGSATIIKTLM